MQSVRVKGDWFEYAHFLEFYDGKCARLHGHSGRYFIEVTLKPSTELRTFTLDFTVIKNFLKEMDDLMDHKLIVNKHVVRNNLQNPSMIDINVNTVYGPMSISMPKSSAVLLNGFSTAENILIFGMRKFIERLVQYFGSGDISNLFYTFIDSITMQFFEGVDNKAKLKITKDNFTVITDFQIE